jgi:hypothetical protein
MTPFLSLRSNLDSDWELAPKTVREPLCVRVDIESRAGGS